MLLQMSKQKQSRHRNKEHKEQQKTQGSGSTATSLEESAQREATQGNKRTDDGKRDFADLNFSGEEKESAERQSKEEKNPVTDELYGYFQSEGGRGLRQGRLEDTLPQNPAMPKADFYKPNPLDSDVVMDATARLLAPKKAVKVPSGGKGQKLREEDVSLPASKREKAAGKQSFQSGKAEADPALNYKKAKQSDQISGASSKNKKKPEKPQEMEHKSGQEQNQKKNQPQKEKKSYGQRQEKSQNTGQNQQQRQAQKPPQRKKQGEKENQRSSTVQGRSPDQRQKHQGAQHRSAGQKVTSETKVESTRKPESPRQKDSTEQESLMKPYYIEHDD